MTRFRYTLRFHIAMPAPRKKKCGTIDPGSGEVVPPSPPSWTITGDDLDEIDDVLDSGTIDAGTIDGDTGSGTIDAGSGKAGSGQHRSGKAGSGTIDTGSGKVDPGSGKVGSGKVDPGSGKVDPGSGKVDPGSGSDDDDAFTASLFTGVPDTDDGAPTASGKVDPGSGKIDPGSGKVDPGSGKVGSGKVDPGSGKVDPGSGKAGSGQHRRISCTMPNGFILHGLSPGFANGFSLIEKGKGKGKKGKFGDDDNLLHLARSATLGHEQEGEAENEDEIGDDENLLHLALRARARATSPY